MDGIPLPLKFNDKYTSAASPTGPENDMTYASNCNEMSDTAPCEGAESSEANAASCKPGITKSCNSATNEDTTSSVEPSCVVRRNSGESPAINFLADAIHLDVVIGVK